MPVTNYVWDPLSDNVLLETDETHATTAMYTQEPDTFGNLISQHREDQTSWHHYDALGSTRQLTDATETVTDTNLYDAWGVNVESTGTTENPFRWVGESGYCYDPDTDEHYVRARMYSPLLARFTSTDPFWQHVEPASGMCSTYRYADSAPIDHSDPAGLKPIPAGLCPKDCGDCELDSAEYKCSRGTVGVPYRPRQLVCGAGQFPRWTRTFQQRTVYSITPCYRELADGSCCREDMKVTTALLRCFRDPLFKCKNEREADRSRPYNFKLLGLVLIERSNRSCNQMPQPDERCWYQCEWVQGVLASTPPSCISKDKWSPRDCNNFPTEWCSILPRLPWGEPKENPKWACPEQIIT